ncbi:MAG: diphosphomevalonate decarboxylase [Gammaproteobacteria bacterium RIFCSPHIGHO2_12_FULL_38_14]|nr:MAG: diphosphomevalonate decarboxylase [Gammaproteobacteria bacterium RIFCSPHIGHO2_12_FULL_38_14]
MKKSDVLKIILKDNFSKLSSAPTRDKGLAFAPTNIALCKYWGKRDAELNLPLTSSLSIALPDKGAMTQLKIHDQPHDSVILNGTTLENSSVFVQRLSQFLDLFRTTPAWHVEVDIKMNLPVAAGLASSACGFASLVLALNDLFEWNLEKQYLSILARLGSGSAARSLWSGFVEWHAGVQSDGMDSYGEPLEFEWPELCVGVLTINTNEKPISSRDAMQRTVNSSVLYSAWPKKVSQDISIIKHALQVKNFPLLAGTAESNALTMHATMLSSWPPICYFLPETVSAMHQVWKLRQEGLTIYFTQDAGPNLKLLFLKKDRDIVQSRFENVEVIEVFVE